MKPSLINKIRPYLKLLRTKDARGCFLASLFGFIITKGYQAQLLTIIIYWLIVFLFLSFGFAINDCFDLKEDTLDPSKQNPIVLKRIKFSNAIVFSFALVIFGLILSFIINFKVFLFSLIAILIALFYSAPPLRLKSKPFFDLLSHGLFYPLILFLPFVVFQASILLVHYLILINLFYVSIIFDLRNEWEEYEPDKQAGVKNTFNFFSYQFSEKLLKFLALLYPTFFILIFNSNFNLISYLPYVIVSILIYVLIFILKSKTPLVKTYKIFDIYIVILYIFIVFGLK